MRAEAPTVTRSLLIDAGAEFNGYAADITRTYSASGTDDFAALIHSVDELQQRICGEVKPDVDFVVLHAFTHRQLATVLRDHQIVRAAPTRPSRPASHARSYPMASGICSACRFTMRAAGSPTTRGASASRPPKTRICD